jgi:hypothetical protein
MGESTGAERESGGVAATGEPSPNEQDDLAQSSEVPQPTATAIALLTLQPPETPEATPTWTEPVKEDQPEMPPYRTLTIIIVILVLVIIIVIAIGLSIRWIRK